MNTLAMDQPASIRVKNRRMLPDVVDYQLQLNAKNSLMKVQPNQANGKTYISVFSTSELKSTAGSNQDTQSKKSSI